mmetsp:Transcript_25274/g.55258  ORF Transcript_25274/g.55258 Transcript_25274/m.55258 type:complete len:264 (+) Transcript_25274:48-839(+)
MQQPAASPLSATALRNVMGSPHLLSAWKTELLLPIEPPRTINVRTTCRGMLCISQLDPAVKVSGIKETLYERLMLKPTQEIRLYSWGRQLEDDQTLVQCALQNNAIVEMQLGLQRAKAHPLQRVRIASTALKTRQILVDETTKVADLKKRIEELHRKGEHEWFDEKGNSRRVKGTTLLASATTKADEKAGTSATRQGEEYVLEGHYDASKKAALHVRKADSGRPLVVSDQNVVLLELPAAKQRLSFNGKILEDEQLLEEIGVQ